MKTWSIRRQLLFNALMPAALVALLLATTLMAGRFADLEEAYLAHASGLGRNIAATAEYSIFSGNRAALERLVGVAMQDTGVTTAGIFDPRGEMLAWQGGGDVPAPTEVRQAATGLRHYGVGAQTRMLLPILGAPIAGDPLADVLIAADPNATPAVSGFVLLDISRAEIVRRKGHVLITGIIIIFASLGLAALIAIRISHRISHPVQGLIEVVTRIGAGETEARVVPQATTHSLRQLEDGVNAMAARIGITQERLRHEIDVATGELRRQKDAAEVAAQLRFRILSTASHDLRQPLHALGMFVSRLNQFQHPPKVGSLVTYVEESVGALASMLDAVLDVSKLEAGLIRANPVEFPIGNLLKRLGDDYSALAARHGLLLSARLAPWRVVSDPVLLERILRNLISNAIRYTPQGGIVLGCRVRDGQLRIEVWDSGRGIAPESQQEIFREFVQVGTPVHDSSKGLGLGLSIVERTARLMGHPIGLCSRPGHGSMFHITVPLTGAVAAARAEPAAAWGELPAMTVVIVDDDALVRRSVQELLEGWGCRCLAAASGDAALAALAPGQVPDLLICDYHLSAQENGFAVRHRFRERYGTAVPAIMMTGETDAAVARQAERLNLPLLHKPVSPARLRTLLHRFAEEYGHTGAGRSNAASVAERGTAEPQ